MWTFRAVEIQLNIYLDLSIVKALELWMLVKWNNLTHNELGIACSTVVEIATHNQAAMGSNPAWS